MSGQEYPTLYEFLKAHRTVDDTPITHTRIGDTKNNIYPGKYSIPHDDVTRKQFLKLYYRDVILSKKKEYLTEVQMEEGPVLIDFDFRYEPSIQSRQHGKSHLKKLVKLYARTIHKLFVLPSQTISIFVLEKPDTNVDNEAITKDGIHMIIGIRMSHEQQTLLRKHVLESIGDVLGDLPLTNDYESVLDDGITYGHTNWQMFGSCKPFNQTYKLTRIFKAIPKGDDGYEIKSEACKSLYDGSPESNAQLKPLVAQLSAHYTRYPSIEIRDAFEQELSTVVLKKSGQRKRKTCRVRTMTDKGGQDTQTIDNELNIYTLEELEEKINHYFDNIPAENYSIREIYEYVMALPTKYADEYPLWIRVGWALHNMDHCKSMFLIWMRFSAKSDKFSFDEIDDHYEKWTKMYGSYIGGKKGYRKNAIVDSSGNAIEDEKQVDQTDRVGIVTVGTIMFWVKKECPEKYEEIKKETVDQMIEKTTKTGFTEVEIANILYKLYEGQYASVGLKQSGQSSSWYEFKDHRWYENESGKPIRDKIIERIAPMYVDKIVQYTQLKSSCDSEDEKMVASLEKKLRLLSEIHVKLLRTSNLKNIMIEANNKFYDGHFYKNLDTNPYLMCCRNGVLDFKKHEFRPGRPEDYISMSTHIDYIPYSEFTPEQKEIEKEVIEFMEQLFPENELNRYMWDHLASTLVGTNMTQTFNIYTGSGANGKSILVDLMKSVLGDYKGTVPIALVTKKRNTIGSVSPEVIQLKGTRYAVMQESTKGDVINEGVMKELTGGDPIQARALFKDIVTFHPQFKLAVCTNTLFDIRSNDDGTWRRIRVCDFMSKFVGPHDNMSKEEYPYQFPKNEKLKERFPYWKEVFLSMLVERLKVTDGHVEDCPHVLEASNRYREGQDIFADFFKHHLVRNKTSSVKVSEVYREFKQWYIETYSRNNPPKRKDMEDYLTKKMGQPRGQVWKGWEYRSEEYDDEEDDEEDEEE